MTDLKGSKTEEKENMLKSGICSYMTKTFQIQ